MDQNKFDERIQDLVEETEVKPVRRQKKKSLN